MIIGLAGRISSGKRVLCNILEKQGYERIYFALPLKRVLTTLLRFPSIQKLDEMKNVERDYVFHEADYAYLAKELDMPLNYILDKMERIKFKTVRQLLQYVGTDVIRTYDANWHINKLRELINPYKDYVIDDLRFPNEKRFIEEMHGDCWYICRPKLDNVINHSSETSLKWQDFGDNIIINDTSLENLVFKWETFTTNYKESMAHRIGVLETLKSIKNGIEDVADPFSTFDMFMIPKDLFTYKQKEWDDNNIKSYEIDYINNLIITYNDGTSEYINNKLNIEDFKLKIKHVT